jgi:hypothetical protein
MRCTQPRCLREAVWVIRWPQPNATQERTACEHHLGRVAAEAWPGPVLVRGVTDDEGSHGA